MQDFIYSGPFDENNLDWDRIRTLIKKHENTVVAGLKNKKDYYDGKHQILTDKRKKREGQPDNKTVCNHAKDISDTATGYFMGNPITYKNTAIGDEVPAPTRQHGGRAPSAPVKDACKEIETDDNEIEALTTHFDDANTDEADYENALSMSVFGRAYEYIYVAEGEHELKTRTLPSEHCFLVKDDTIERRELFAVYYFRREDDSTGKQVYVMTVLTKRLRHTLESSADDETVSGDDAAAEPHQLSDIPIIEYQNNKDCFGDFEQQIGLIDAYNNLMADRVNDKEQFVNSLLVIYGAILGDDSEEISEAIKLLRDNGLLELPDSAKAEYLARTLDEAGAEVLRQAIKQDIYTFSHVPNLSDENFVGNSSGVAMEFKLLGLEMLTKTKERYYKSGLRKRIRLFCDYYKLAKLRKDYGSVVASFSRGLPKNLLEISQVVGNLKGSVSNRTLLDIVPFVEDPANEVARVDAEKAEDAKRQRELFGGNPNDPPPDEDEKPAADIDKGKKPDKRPAAK